MQKIYSILTGIILTTTLVAQENWITYKANNNSFQILIPQEPELQIQEINTAIGVLEMHIYSSQSTKQEDENIMYMIMHTDYPNDLVSSQHKEKLADFFRNAINGAVNNVGGILLSEKDIELNGYPGKEITISYQNGAVVITMRQYLVENRTYILQLITMKEKQGNKSITKFLESFKLPRCS